MFVLRYLEVCDAASLCRRIWSSSVMVLELMRTAPSGVTRLSREFAGVGTVALPTWVRLIRATRRSV